MLIIGCDFHTRYQQITMVDTLTRELTERRLDHESGEAHPFYRGLAGWWNQFPPQDSRCEPWSECKKEKRFFQVKKKRALALANWKCLLTEPTPS